MARQTRPSQCVLLSVINVTPPVDPASASHPVQPSRSCMKMVAPMARITGIVPTISAAWLTVVSDSA